MITLAETHKRCIYFTFLFLFVGAVISDAMGTWLQFNGSSFYRISIIVRGISLVVLGGYTVLLGLRKGGFYLIGGWSLLFAVFSMAVGIFVHPWFGEADYGTTAERYGDSFLLIIKFFYVFIVYVALQAVFNNRKRFKKLANLMDAVLLLYIGSIWIGVFSGLEWLQAYQNHERYGFKGIIPAVNETTGFLLIGVAWFFVRYLHKERNILWLVTTILASFLVGAKGLFFGIPFLLFLLIYATSRRKTMLLSLGGGGTFLVGIVLWAYVYVPLFTSVVEGAWNYHSHWYNIYIERGIFPWIRILTSGRDLKFMSILPLAMEHRPLFWLIGGFPVGAFSVEIDTVDIVFLFGLPLALGAIIFYWKWIVGEKSLRDKERRILLAFAISWFLIATTGGHLFFSARLSPFLAVLVFYLHYYKKFLVLKGHIFAKENPFS